MSKTKYFLKGLNEAENDLKKGRITSFDNTNKMLAYLDQEISDEKQRKATNGQ